VTARKRKPARKNTRRARGRRTNRERPTAPYRNGETAAARVIPPAAEDARTHTHVTARETGHQQRFRHRAHTAGPQALTESGDGPGRVPGCGRAAAERDSS
jgi:hypothetical protein